MKLTAKMERWTETRLWNRKADKDAITIKQIASELANLFGISLTPRTQKQLEYRIEQIRSRVYKRHNRWLVRRAEWAGKLWVPERMIERWFRAGWLDPGKPDSINAIAGMIFERDYYFRFIDPEDADERIPENPDISIASI